jgi:hypothetical protein
MVFRRVEEGHEIHNPRAIAAAYFDANFAQMAR